MFSPICRALSTFATLASAAALAACSDAGASRDAAPGEPVDGAPARLVAEVIDSAGVTLRRSPAAAIGRVAYEVSAAPTVLIDGTEGGGAPLHAVDAVAFGPGGRIAIGERGEMGVRLHGPDGSRVMVIGRDGEGPGEFGALNGIGFHADSMYVFDSRLFRISVFDPNGEYARQIVPETTWGERPRWFAFAPSGAILTTSRGSGDNLVWGLHALDGSPIRAFRDAPSPPQPRMSLRPAGEISGPVAPLRLFHAFPSAGTWRGGLVATSGEAYRLQFYDDSGTLSEIWSVEDAEPRRVTDRDIAAAKARALDGADAEVRPAIERRWSRVDPAERFPAFGEPGGLVFLMAPQILEADTGELWVRAYPADPGVGPVWWVFREDGTLSGSVTFPPRFELHAVSAAGAAGIVEDEFDVQRVALFGLTSRD